MSKDIQIRIAFLLDSFQIENWKAECIEGALSVAGVKPCLVVLNREKQQRRNGFFSKIAGIPFRRFAWRFYLHFFHQPNEKKLVSIEDKFIGVTTLSFKPIKKGKFSEYFENNDLESIRKAEPDVIIRFGFGIIRGEVLNIAKYGVWSYHHGDELKYRGGPPGFWEIYKNDHLSAVVLQRLTEELDAGIVLKKAYFKTIYKSYTANLDQILKHGSSLLKQQLVDLINELPMPTARSSTTAKIRTFPVNYQMAKYLFRRCYKVFSFHYRDLFMAEKWNIGIGHGDQDSLNMEGIKDIKWLPEMPRGEYRADPFTYTYNDHLCIIHELYNYKDGKGSIEVQRSNEESNTAIYSKKHLSYPSIIEYKKDIFCVPESYERNRTDIYKLSRNNNKWEFHKTLVDGQPIVDPTILQYENKWWMFCTHEDDEPNSKLYIYHSENLFGPYLPHKNNPVKVDVRSSRPAGNFIYRENEIIRPSQDCSRTYGSAIILNKIIKLTDKEFEEEVIGTINPQNNWKYNKGIHTLNFSEKHIVFDAKRYQFNIHNFKKKFSKKIGRRK